MDSTEIREQNNVAQCVAAPISDLIKHVHVSLVDLIITEETTKELIERLRIHAEYADIPTAIAEDIAKSANCLEHYVRETDTLIKLLSSEKDEVSELYKEIGKLTMALKKKGMSPEECIQSLSSTEQKPVNKRIGKHGVCKESKITTVGGNDEKDY